MGRRFGELRSIRWRVDLGILPLSPEASVDELRRAAADSRRRYASLRRRLLADTCHSKDDHQPFENVFDNPLSQSPDSTWGRLFRNAELEKTIDQDLSRLYPEDNSYFQTPACLAMLRRVLLLWCLQHTECGYRQGMHELLAPLVYVLRVDLDHLSHVQRLHEDCFNGDFDEILFPHTDIFFGHSSRMDINCNVTTDKGGDFQESSRKISTVDDLDPEIRDLFLLSDAYGAEGELGIVLSERFMEHDAYGLFDGLMDGTPGVVHLAEFFSPSSIRSRSIIPPIIEASASIYYILSIVDPSLHSHLVELGVEPQYFALRWLCVLFGREFCLDNLLIIWDEVFACSNSMLHTDSSKYVFKLLSSTRGAFIASFAVSMLLHLRSSLFATEIVTICLQRLLSFPDNADLRSVIEKAKSLLPVALDANSPESSLGEANKNTQPLGKAHSLPSAPSPSRTGNPLPKSYWEEKWQELQCSNNGVEQTSLGKLKSLVQKLGLSRTESVPTKAAKGKKKAQKTVARRRPLDGFSQDMENPNADNSRFPAQINSQEESADTIGKGGPNCGKQETCLSARNSSACSLPGATEHEGVHDEELEKSSTASNSCYDVSGNSSRAISPSKQEQPSELLANTVLSNERRQVSNTFQWLWNLGRPSNEHNASEGVRGEPQKPQCEDCHADVVHCSLSGGVSSDGFCSGAMVDAGDPKAEVTLKNLGQTMLENIQVVELAFELYQQNLSENNSSPGSSKGQAAAKALDELRRISNLLQEM